MDTNRTLCLGSRTYPSRIARRLSSVLDGRYVWLWNLAPGKATEFAAAARLHNFDGFIVKAHDGTTPYNSAHIAEYVSTLKVAKLKLGLWGYVYGKFPQAEALEAVRLCGTYHADFYVADAETEYEHAHYPASAMFTKEFRKLAPGLPAMLSSFGRIDLHPTLNWKAWESAGFDFAPQAYSNEAASLLVSRCVKAAAPVWKPSRVHPTLGAYRGAVGRLTPVQLAAQARACPKGSGFSVWAGDFMEPVEWEALAKV